ncbi:MAG: hypothetical protein M3017_06255 [Actinomycetota bacterium]|nr:hypothetical protein [Actinomycetota bacterium]
MSTPSENDDPEQSASTPPSGGSGSQSGGGAPQQPAPGYQGPPPGYQQPGYQQQPPPGYQRPGYQGPPPGYQQPGYQGPPMYQQPSGYPETYGSQGKSPASDFSNFPQRLRNLTGIPKEVKNAYLLFLAGAALNLVASLINIIWVGSGSSAIYVGAAVVGFVFAIIFAAVFVWLALMMKEGARWARIILIVLAALSLISALVSLVGALLIGVTLINLLASIAFIIGGFLLLRPGAVAYYDTHRRQRFSQP